MATVKNLKTFKKYMLDVIMKNVTFIIDDDDGN